MIVYKVKNKINNKVYIGQTINTLDKRKSQHYGKINSNVNNHFINALVKYDRIDFDWTIIRYCDSKDSLDAFEKYYISYYDSIKSGYNTALGGRTMVWTEEMKKRASESREGIKFSDEHRENLRNACIRNGTRPPSRLGVKDSKETRLKKSDNMIFKKMPNASSKYIGVSYDKGRNKWISQFSQKGNRLWFKRYDSEIEAAVANNNFALKYFGENAKLNDIEDFDAN